MTIKKFVFFFNCSNWENSWRKLWKTRFVVWWFDPMSSLFILRCLSYLFLSFFHFFSEISWKVIIYFELRTSVVNCIEYGSWNKSMYCSSQTIIYDAFVSSIVHFKKFVIFALDNILKNTSQNWRSKKIANTSICSHW